MTGPKPLDEQVADIRNAVLAMADTLGAALPSTYQVNTALAKLNDVAGTCKHCGVQLVKFDFHWAHTGSGKVRCEVEPYGFQAEPMGTPCNGAEPNPCNGARGMEPLLSR